MERPTASDALSDWLTTGAWQSLLDAVDEAMLLVDAADRIVCANDRLWDLFGLAPTTDLIRLRNHIIGCAADADAYLNVVERSPAGHEVEVALARPTKRVVRRRVSPLRTGDGRELGWLLSYRDVTRDAEISRLKTEFVSNVSHELRTPMAAIKGFLGVVLDDEASLEPETRRHFLTIARQETDRLSRLIDDLLDISRIESGRQQRRDSTFAVAELLRDAVAMARPEAGAAGITVELAEPPYHWVLLADRDQMSQVLHNLVGNAVKFTPPGGRVHLEAGAEGDELVLRVSDTGPGIARDELPRVFEKFYRGRAVGVAPRGTGLGLAIAKELAEAHGGRIDVTSEIGQGSTFSVHMPFGATGGTS